ncbi:hypothetical protein [Calothrix sp. NIES-2100]|uniref:hypothetical protein n=1 Tax=Calothrix sp. NIES-2100 TaxID=1954172 RepID=UPI0030DCABE0
MLNFIISDRTLKSILCIVSLSAILTNTQLVRAALKLAIAWAKKSYNYHQESSAKIEKLC